MLPCDNNKLLKINLFEGESYKWHRPPTNLHNFTTAFGDSEKRLGALIKGTINKQFTLETEPFDGCVKLTGLWNNMDENSPVKIIGLSKFPYEISFESTISINGQNIYTGYLDLPIVCAGWPSVYLNIPSGCLKKGLNQLSIDVSGEDLLINQLCVFVRKDSGKVFELLHSPRIITTDRDFWVSLLVYKPGKDIKVTCAGPIELVSEIKESEIGEVDVFFHPTGEPGECSVTITCENEELKIDLPPILRLPAGLPCFVGSDSDDHPHDSTGMMDEIMKHLFRNEIGNMVMFRPKEGRNCIISPTEELCRRWIEICHKYNARYFVCDWAPVGRFPASMHDEMASDPNFIGYHAHEPYFITHADWGGSKFQSTTDYKSAHDLMIKMLRELADSYHARGGAKVAAGEASWMAPYDAEAGFDMINAEAVTSIAPLFGAVRGALRGRPNMKFGHHTAIEWYLGFPYDDLKSRRSWLVMLLAFTYGASYIYTENSLFFTNCNVRHDPEDKFTTDNREIMKKLYDITKLQPRFGEPCAELAVAYGNLESILWYQDDVLPEMEDGSEWMEYAFNRWNDQTCKPAWRALDAWLVPLEIEKYYGNKSILKWFSGNPYGNVDIISTDREKDIYSCYKMLAFLGWNTMSEEVLEKLKSYVFSGGKLFISGCHFDKRTLTVGDYEIDTNGAEEMLGLSIEGQYETLGDVLWENVNFKGSEKTRMCKLNIRDAEVIVSDNKQNPVMLSHKYGDGIVYFCNFWDHPTTCESLDLMKAFMTHFGQKNKSSFGVEDGYGISCNHWFDEESGVRRLYIVNTNWQKPKTSRTCLVRLWNKIYPLTIDESDFVVITEKNRVAAAIDNPLVFVNDIVINDSGCKVTITGNGDYSMNLFFADDELCRGRIISGSVRGNTEVLNVLP